MVGERLKELRAERKMKQIEIARFLEIDRSTYTKYETGDSNPDYNTLQKLADYFDVSTDYLLGRSIFRKSNTTSIPQFKSRFYREETTGERIRKIRIEKAVELDELAEEVGIEPALLDDAENGKQVLPSDVLIEIADFFDVSLDYLTCRTDIPTPISTIAAHSDNPKGLPPEAHEEVIQYIEFIKQKYGIDKKKK